MNADITNNELIELMSMIADKLIAIDKNIVNLTARTQMICMAAIDCHNNHYKPKCETR